jgi:hypothetical protein
VSPMGSFLDHLEEAARELRALRQRERLERAANRADLAKRTASRGPARVARSEPTTVTDLTDS